jgi:small subunit ribosomal protein S7
MRSGPTTKRTLTPDPVYQDVLITRLINRVMKDGKKTVAEKQIYRALDILSRKQEKDSVLFLKEAIESIKPQMEVRARRIGGAAYQVPSPVRGDRREALAIRWLVNAANDRPNKEYHTFAEKLVAELMDATSGQGAAMKKKSDMHRMAEANKAFAHFRW